MSTVLSAALGAVNGDIGESGYYSPQQFVFGKQPRLAGMVIPSGLRDRLAAHSLIENSPSMERQIAMKEMARVSMVRLKYSRSLRRAELARARKPVLAREYQTGDLVYFWREQKPEHQGKDKTAPMTPGRRTNMRRKLLLKRWHGPALVLSQEMNSGGLPIAVYVAYRGNCTKVAIEHIRHASTLTWRG